MTREETIKLLKLVSANYPNTKINDAAATATVWEMNLGEYPAESVYKAARLHMQTCKFFPTPADILKHMQRAELIFDVQNVPAIESKTNTNDDEFLEKFIQAQIEWETDMFSNFLDYEK